MKPALLLFEKPTATDPSCRLCAFDTASLTPLQKAPSPAVAVNSSFCKGSKINPAMTTSSLTSAMTTVHAGMPDTKFAVPSIGSITHI